MSRLSASEVINRGDYLQPDFEPSTLTIPHLLSVLTYHGIKYPSPHTKGKLIDVFNAEIRPRSAQLLKERQVRDRKKPSHEGIFDGHTGKAIEAPEPAPVRRSTRRSSRQPSEPEPAPQPAPVMKRRRSSAGPTMSRGSSRIQHQAPAEPILAEESEPEGQDKPDEEPPRKSSRTRATLRSRRQSAGLSDHGDSAWEDNNVFQSGAESSSPMRPSPARRQPKSRAAPPVTRRASKRNSLSAPPQLFPQAARSPEPEPEPEPLPEPVIEPQAFQDVPSSPAFAPRVSVPAGGLRAFNPPPAQIRKSIAAAEASAIMDAVESSSEEEEEVEEETQKPEHQHAGDLSRGPDVADDEEFDVEVEVEDEEVEVEVEDRSVTPGAVNPDDSYEQLEEPMEYSSAVAKRIAAIGDDSTSGRALVRRPDVQPPPILPQWLTILLGLGLSLLVSMTTNYKMESSAIGWCDTGSNSNSIIVQREASRAAQYECAERLYLNSTLGAVGMIESGDGATAGRQEVMDGLMHGECTPLPLLPIPHPQTCTPCPDHAECTPPYGITCAPGYILKQHPVAVVPGLRELANGLPGFGAVAFPPHCAEDDARKRKVSGVAKGMATYLETIKGERICSGVEAGGKPVDGGEPKKFGIQVQELAQLVSEGVKRSPSYKGDLQDIFQTALNDLEKAGWIERSADASGNQWVASKRSSMGAVCRVKVGARETWSEWQMHFYTLIGAILSAIWARSKVASKRRESRRVAELAGIALDLVRNQEIQHHTDPVRTPYAYVSSLHLRDMVLQEEHNVRERVRLWAKVARIVEGNANVRANVEEVAGDETRVWRWVGAASSCE